MAGAVITQITYKGNTDVSTSSTSIPCARTQEKTYMALVSWWRLPDHSSYFCRMLSASFAGAKSASDSISSASAHADEDIKVELVATSTGKGHVTYGPSLSSSTSSADFENEWKQEAETKRKDGYSLDVSSFDEGVEVTCKIIVNGEVKDEQKATGDGYSSAHCNLSADFGYGDK